MKRVFLMSIFSIGYVIGVLIFRAILFARTSYFYEWTITEEVLLISSMTVFFLLHYIFLNLVQNYLPVMKLNNRLLKFDVVFCVLWIAIIVDSAFLGMRIGKYIFLDLTFNTVPIFVRIIYMRQKECRKGQGDGNH